MAKQEDVAKALEVIPEATSLIEIVKQAAREVKFKDPTHLMRIAAASIRLNPKLAKCSAASFVGSLIVLEQVELEPVAGRAYLLPFLNNRKMIINGKEEWRKQLEVQALIGYKGISDLFYRNESALALQMHTVREKDFFEYEYGTQGYLRHKPATGERGKAIGYWAQANMKGGGVLFLYMSKEECIGHAKKHSKVYDKNNDKFIAGTPWANEVDAMCMKTVLLQLAKNLPLSIKTQRALSVDQTSREYRPGIHDALDLPDTTNWQEEPIETEASAVENGVPKVEAKPSKKEDKEPVTKSPLPQNVQAAIATARTKVGDKVYQKVLGEQLGYSRMEEIPNIKEANKLLDVLGKAYAEAHQ